MVKKRGLLLITVLLILSSFVSAHDIILTLRDTNNDYLDRAMITVESQDSVINKFLEAKEDLKLTLETGAYELIIKADDITTPGKDYIRKLNLDVSDSIAKQIYLYKTASLRGVVKDKLDNIIPNAELRFECSQNIGIELPTKTSAIGSFHIEYFPAGQCKIYANYRKIIGTKDITLERGALKDIEIKLEESIAKPSNILLYIQITIIIITALAISIYITKRKKEPKVAHEIKHEPIKRAEDITQTLNNKEKEVVSFLQMNNNKSTQATIRHNTGIPRTSLARVLHSLESKNIAKVRKEGKLVKITLTDWFLGKE